MSKWTRTMTKLEAVSKSRKGIKGSLKRRRFVSGKGRRGTRRIRREARFIVHSACVAVEWQIDNWSLLSYDWGPLSKRPAPPPREAGLLGNLQGRTLSREYSGQRSTLLREHPLRVSPNVPVQNISCSTLQPILPTTELRFRSPLNVCYSSPFFESSVDSISKAGCTEPWRIIRREKQPLEEFDTPFKNLREETQKFST